MNAPIKPSAIRSSRSLCSLARNWTPSSPGKDEQSQGSLGCDDPTRMPRNVIRERTLVGLDAARARGRSIWPQHRAGEPCLVFTSQAPAALVEAQIGSWAVETTTPQNRARPTRGGTAPCQSRQPPVAGRERLS